MAGSSPDEQPGVAERVTAIIDEACPPGSEIRGRLDATAEELKALLVRHGYGYLLEDD